MPYADLGSDNKRDHVGSSQLLGENMQYNSKQKSLMILDKRMHKVGLGK